MRSSRINRRQQLFLLPSLLVLTNFSAHAFSVPYSNHVSCTTSSSNNHASASKNIAMMTRPRPIISLLRAQSNDDNEGDSENVENDETDDSLLQELRNIKSQNNLDATTEAAEAAVESETSIETPPPATKEELSAAATNAENAFLSAMLEQTQKFKEIKSDEGSERAVEAFMERMRLEDEAREEEREAEGDEARGVVVDEEVEEEVDDDGEGNDGGVIGEGEEAEKRWLIQDSNSIDGTEKNGDNANEENNDGWQ